MEIHGTIRSAVCVNCNWRGDMMGVFDRVRAGESDPPCEGCGGILKSATVYFGEHLDPNGLHRSFAAAESCDVLLAVGTSLSVYPIAAMVPTAAGSGATVVILNAEDTDMDDMADFCIRGPISETLADLLR